MHAVSIFERIEQTFPKLRKNKDIRPKSCASALTKKVWRKDGQHLKKNTFEMAV